ncbi:MAG: hypothetical protein ACE5H3_09685 [Planctomycetota bacterium]
MSRLLSSPKQLLLLLLALLPGVFLGLSPVLLSEEGGFGGGPGGGGNRGGNPTVGSLPSLVDGNLDIQFAIPLENGLGGVPLPGVPPTLGFIGPPELADSLIDAQGDPYGVVNRPEDWTVFGLRQNGTAWFHRAAAANGAVKLWSWVPEEFLGGTFLVQGSITTHFSTITTQAFNMMLPALASRPEPFGSVTMMLAPPTASAALGARTVVVTLTPTVVQVDFLVP